MPIEPPYGIIWQHLCQGEVIAFLGAGASLRDRPEGVSWDEEAGGFLPRGWELAERLAEESTYPATDPNDRKDLAKIASFYQESADRLSLRQRLRQIFCQPYRSGAIHDFLAEVSAPLLIVTTNYDNLIEQAFEKRQKPYHLVVYPADQFEYAASVLWWKPGAVEPEPYHPAQLPLSVTDTPIIYKMHGSVHRPTSRWDNFVITEEDYVDFLSRMTGQNAIPARFMAEFRRKRFLFLGYGLSDWNLRVMLKNLKTALSSPLGGKDDAMGPPVRSWAIQHRPSELEQLLWRSRSVNIYDLPIDEFVARMKSQAK